MFTPAQISGKLIHIDAFNIQAITSRILNKTPQFLLIGGHSQRGSAFHSGKPRAKPVKDWHLHAGHFHALHLQFRH
jgi:hypothetical protein